LKTARRQRHARRDGGELCHSHPVATAVAKARMASHMTTVGIAVYMTADGEPARDLLSHLGWVIGIGAEIAAEVAPGLPQAKRLHAALRTVIQLSMDNAWQAAQAGVLSDAANEASAGVARAVSALVIGATARAASKSRRVIAIARSLDLIVPVIVPTPWLRLRQVVACVLYLPQQHHLVIFVDGVVAVHRVAAAEIAEPRHDLDLVVEAEPQHVLPADPDPDLAKCRQKCRGPLLQPDRGRPTVE